MHRRIAELSTTVANSLSPHLLTHIYPRSTILLSLHVLSQDGGLLAALINAATLALVDAGVPMVDMVVASTAGFTSSSTSSTSRSQTSSLPGLSLSGEVNDPLLDLSALEEQDLPFLTVATVGATRKVAACVCETRMEVARLEQMLAVAVDGCKAIKGILENVVREQGRSVVLGEEEL
jgi:exosome complex component RRP41